MVEGMQLSMRGKGNAGKRNGINGDLLIVIEEEKHPELIRDENDLMSEEFSYDDGNRKAKNYL